MPNRDPVTGRFTSGGGSSGGGVSLGNAYGAVIIDVSGVGSAMKQAQADIQSGLSGIGQKIGDSLKGVGSGLEDVGQSITGISLKVGALVAPIALFGKKAISQFTDFNEAMTNVQAVTGASADEIKSLSDQILELGKHSRSGPQAVAEAFYDIAGGVTDASVRMSTLEAAIKASEAGNADLGITTKALIAIMNGYGFSADKAEYATDVLTQTVAKGYGEMGDFASALPQVASMASTLGISFQDLGAQMAYITTKGVSASDAGTQLQGMMVSLINPTKEMQDALEKIGFSSGKAAIAQLGLAGTFKKFKDAGIDVTSLGGRIEAMRGAITLTGNDAKSFLDNFALGLKGLTEETRKIQNASPAAQLDFFNSAMSTLSITIGQSLAPALNSLLGQLLPVIDSVLEWVRQNPELVGQIGMIVGALTVALPVVASIGFAISTVGTIIKGLGAAITLLTSGPIGLILLAGAAIAVLFKDQIGAGIQSVIDGLKNGVGIFEAIGAAILDVFGSNPITLWIANTLVSIQNFFNNFQLYWSLVKLYAEYYMNGVVAAIQGVINKVKEWISQNPEFTGAMILIGGAVLILTGILAAVPIVVSLITGAVGLLTGALGLLFSPAVLVAGAIAGIVFAADKLYPGGIVKLFNDAVTAAGQLGVIFFGTGGAAKWITDRLSELVQTLKDFKTGVEGLAGIINLVSSGKVSIGDVVKAAGNEISSNAGNGNAYADVAVKHWGNKSGGVVPIPSVGGGSAAPLRDVGGPGFAGMEYQIGRQQLQNEIYIPGADGQFVSGFVDLMKQVAAGVTNNRGGDTINVQMPAAALANPAGAYAAGQDFGRGVADEMRAQGVKGVR